MPVLRTALASLLLLGPIHAGQAPEPQPPSPFERPPVAVPSGGLHVDRRMAWPRYPMLALMGRIEGIVRLRILVGPEGNVLGARALEGPRELLGSAERDVHGYRFKPLLVQGKPVIALTEVGLPYALRDEQVDPAGKPVTGYVLRLESDVPSWGDKVDLGFIPREVQACLGRAGLEARDPATADPDATLDLTLTFAGTNSLGLATRASLVRNRRAAGNSKGEPVRVWSLQGRANLPSRDHAEKVCRGLLGDALDTLVPVSARFPGLMSLLLHEGDPAFGAPAWDPVKCASNSAMPSSVDFDFSAMRIAYQPPPPLYPPLAKAARIQGTVVVAVEVDPLGGVLWVRAMEGPRELHRVAEDYALQWRFEPAVLDGIPRTVRFKLSVPFRLK